MTDLGDRLKRARQDRGATLKDIAKRTKIAVTALEALERNDFSRLPGGIFGRAFVRAYALEIGLDPEATVNDFRVLLERDERAAAERGKVRPEVTADDRAFLDRQRRAIRLLRLGVGLVALSAIGLLAWRFGPMWSRRGPAATTAPTSDELAPPASAAAPVAALDPHRAASGGWMTEHLVVEFQVVSDTWVVATTDGQNAVSQLFTPGTTHRLEADREIALDTANAGALTWTINGKPAKPLGRAGAHGAARVTRDTVAAFLQ